MDFIDLGRMAYARAYEEQQRHHAAVLADRERVGGGVGRILFVEHDPVITIGRHPGAAMHIIAAREAIAAAGVEVVETDRGGDVTYHGPGQLVVYPILDLNRLGLGIHAYMRMLEGIVMAVCGRAGLGARREEGATGVWVGEGPGRKVCAMGVRIRRWVSLHGLALNVDADLSPFDLIVACGLTGRGITSLARELGPGCPAMERVKAWMREEIAAAVEAACARVAAGGVPTGPASS